MRKFCADDAEFLEEARRRDFPDGWKREMILSSLKGETFAGLIEEENGKTIAAITFDKAADSADIECVYVLPEKRKNGYALSLINALLAELKESGTEKVFLEVRESNVPARSLYKKAGFTEISVRKRYYGEENAVVMEKEIIR